VPAPGSESAGPLGQPFRCTAKVRYRQTDQPALFVPQPDGTARLVFDQPQRAVTPGQYAVIYDGDRCLGGAVIETVLSQRCMQRAEQPPTRAGPETTPRNCLGQFRPDGESGGGRRS